MVEFLGAVAAITAAIAAVISALKAGETAGAVTKLTQHVEQVQNQLVSLQQAQQQKQNQQQQVFTGNMTFTGEVHQHLGTGSSPVAITGAVGQTELFGETASPLIDPAVGTPTPEQEN